MTDPTVTDFKQYFVRDFPYGNIPSTVMNVDIEKAQAEAKFNFNASLFATQAEYSMAFNYLTAHYLVMDLRASSQGIQGSYPWMVTSKSVGSVSQGSQIPDQIMANPVCAMFSQTYYGTKYLSLVLPRMVANMGIAYGRTLP